jgi:Major Facilitator Superfamily
LVAFVALGLPGSSFGVAWPSIRSEFGLPLSALGLVVIATGAGFVLSSASSGWVATRMSTRWLVVVAAALLAFGTCGLGLAPAFWVVLACGVVAGAGGGLLDAGLTAHVALRRGLRSMNALHASWGVGSTVGTLMMTAAVALASWRAAFFVMGLVYLVLAAVFLVLPAAGGAGAEAAPGRAPGLSLALVLALTLFFVYTGLESGAGAWSFSYLVGGRLAPVAAGLLVSAYWAALTGGRALLALAGGRLSARRLLDVSVAVSLVGAVAMLLGVPFGLPVIGLGLAAVYPALMNLTPERLGRSAALHAVGYQTASGNLGATLLPAGAGVVLQAGGVALLPVLLIATVAVMLLLHVAAARAS